MDEKAYLKAYDKNSDAIFRFIYFRVRDREEAKDLLQDTFMKVWRYVSEGHTIDNAKAFLYQTARNLIIDRSRKRTNSSLDELREHGFEIGSDERPRLEHVMDANIVLTMVDKLDEKYREPVLLRYVDGFSPKEIANILDESTNVISVRIHRGIRLLKTLMKRGEQ